MALNILWIVLYKVILRRFDVKFYLFSPLSALFSRRECAAQLLAIPLAVANSKVFMSHVETLLTAVSTANNNYEKMSGGLMALGSIIGRRFMTADAKGGMAIEDLEVNLDGRETVLTLNLIFLGNHFCLC